MDNKEKQFSLSWFFRWFLDNKAITVFLVTLLLGLNLLVLSKITFIFIPIFEFAGAVMLPVIISGLLYYLLNPIVDFLERKGLKRIFAISLVFFLIAVLLIWGLAVVIPSVQRQVVSFFHNLPTYLEKANATIDDFLDNRVSSDIKPQLDEITIVCKHYFLGQFDLWAGCQLGQQLDRSGFASYCCLDHHAFYCLLSSSRWKKFKGPHCSLFTD